MKNLHLPIPAALLVALMATLLSSCQTANRPELEAQKAVNDREGVYSAQPRSQTPQQSYQQTAQKYSAPVKPGWNDPVPVPPANMATAGLSYSRVSISEPYVALTFDDGPHPSNTPRLLDMLKQRNIKATFYVVGTNSKAYPHILRRMIAEGHEIGNHTWNHPDLTKLSLAKVREEMESSRDAIVAATGVRPRSYRPPYGAVNANLKAYMKNTYGYPTIMWSVDPMDWKKPGASVVADRLVSGAHNGAILLVHDIHSSTIDAMPSAMDRLLAKGYRFVTVSQLIALGNRATASTEGDSENADLMANLVEVSEITPQP